MFHHFVVRILMSNLGISFGICHFYRINVFVSLLLLCVVILFISFQMYVKVVHSAFWRCGSVFLFCSCVVGSLLIRFMLHLLCVVCFYDIQFILLLLLLLDVYVIYFVSN
jgi:hypothetical protein